MGRSVHQKSEVQRLLWELLPQGRASLCGPDGTPIQGQLFPPTELGSVPFLRTDPACRPEAGATLQVRCENRGTVASFFTNLVGYDTSGRLMLTPPSCVQLDELAGQTEGFHLFLLRGARLAEQPLVHLGEDELSFRFSCFDLELRLEQRLYGELRLPDGSSSQITLRVDELEQGEGSGERVAIVHIEEVSPLGAGYLDLAA